MLMIGKEFGRKWSWPTRGFVPESAEWIDVNHENHNQENQCTNRNSNGRAVEESSSALPLDQPIRSYDSIKYLIL